MEKIVYSYFQMVPTTEVKFKIPNLRVVWAGSSLQQLHTPDNGRITSQKDEESRILQMVVNMKANLRKD
jgi:hypothetical protein